MDSTTSAERDQQYPKRVLKFILAIAMGIISFPVLGKTAFNNSQLTPVKMWVMTSAFTLLHLSKCKTLGIFDSVANSFVEAT